VVSRTVAMNGIDQIYGDLAEAIEADIDAGESAQEMDRSILQEMRNPTRALPTPDIEEPEVSPKKKTIKAAARAEGAVPAEEDAVVDGSVSKIAELIAGCKKCALHKTRTNTVPGQGNNSPEIMFIGEAPGADEDAQGLAFVGRAGKLLNKMIVAMGYTREDVFIGNILKCRPPDNRVPMPDEMTMCMPYLRGQIRALKPKVIIALGGTSVKALLKTDIGITKLRGNWTEFEGVPFMPTLHPAYLLRNPKAKHDAWADLQSALKKLGKKAPPAEK
jgi:uracil-DNA glycosylase family 4